MPLYMPSPIRILAQSAVAVSKTGDTNESTLATVTIPGGAMGPNGILRITTLWSFTNNANNKTPRIRLGSIAGTQIFNNGYASAASARHQAQIANRNSEALQVAFQPTNAVGFGSSTAGNPVGSQNTAVDWNLVITGQLAVGTDAITLEAYLVELIPG